MKKIMVSTGLLLICSMALSDISKQQTDTRRLECEISIEDQVVAKNPSRSLINMSFRKV